MLAAAIGIYVANYSLLAGNIIWNWFVVVFFIVDTLYLFAAIPVAREDLSTFELIRPEDAITHVKKI
jgi:hypothetical protein